MTAQSLRATSSFGERYALRRRIAVGGMAEIFLARQLTPGFEKNVVIKRLRPELVSDHRVRAMFSDEATIGSLVNHPNTVHIYDVGDDSGTPYIAMEYIDGEELNALCRRSLSLGNFLPLEHAVELIRQAAMSLGHFHATRDEAGRPLDIVHCDISPTNLLVTTDGFAKVIDFGIARFRGQTYVDAAAVPGKLSYMSPEQAKREKLDNRSDIFALGIVLYEITLGRRLFKGPASEVVSRLTAGDIKPPTFVSNNYPGGLESIVMRALELRPTDRYSTAFDLADDLAAFLAETDVAASGPLAVARYLDRLVVAAGGERRAELISEREEDDIDDELDFDRGIARDLGSSVQTSASVAEWDEYEEDEQAVADALGIDVHLVRTQMRADGGDIDGGFEPADDELADVGITPPVREEAPEETPTRGATADPPSTPALSARDRLDPASSIRPLDPPSNMGKMIAAAIAGGVIMFLILQFLT